jgi:hypothetical protein
MSKYRLRCVRRDVSVAVYTEHADRIHPRELSDRLVETVGKGEFRVSLRKNIYVIYVHARRSDNDDVSIVLSFNDLADECTQKQDIVSDNVEGREKCTIEPTTYQERLEDFKMAKKILSNAWLPDQ